MKKILLAAVAALAIVGCSQNEEIEKAGEKAEINFGTVVKAGTKAAITETGKFSYISKFHIIISCKLIVYIVMCFYQETN